MRGLGRRLLAAVMAATTLGATVLAVAPSASATARMATAPTGLVTRTLPVSMTCSDGTDPTGTGPLDHVLANLVVQATAPAVVPFGGTFNYTNVRYAVTMAASQYGGAPSQMWFGPANNVMPTGAGVGASINLISPGRYTSPGYTSGPIDVHGLPGQVVTLPVGQLTAQWSVYFPPYGGYTIHETCTPDPGTPLLATTVIGPPPGGASVGDEVIMAVRDQTSGTIVYQANAFVTSGNFVLAPPGDGIHVIGTSTFPGLAGGMATFSLISTRKTVEVGGGAVTFSTTVLSLSDSGAGVALNGFSNQTVYGGPELNSENIYGVAAGTLAGSGHPAVISWEIRDLA